MKLRGCGGEDRERATFAAVEAATGAGMVLGGLALARFVSIKHEPKGDEADSWQRAIHLTGGWPADETESLTATIGSASQPDARS